MSEQENIIETKNITKEFNGTIAVKGITFSVPRGKIFGFVGPSGSGKTTTIRMLTGYHHPTSGEISVLGCSPENFSRIEREKIGYLPQLFGLYPNLTVWENLNFAASIYGMPIHRYKRLVKILKFVELEDERNKLANQLSGGMQRRLSLAATLVHDPELIFLDEPTAGVDPVLRLKFWEHFRSLQEQGCTLIVTTQYVSETAYCDLVGVINKGRLVILDTPSMLRYRAYGGDLVDFHSTDPLDYSTLQEILGLPYVLKLFHREDNFKVRLLVKEAKTDLQTLMDWARNRGIKTEAIGAYLPPFDDVFVELMKKEDENA